MDTRGRPDPDEEPRVAPMGGDPRRYYAVIGVLLVVIAVLAIRPWDPFGELLAQATPGRSQLDGSTATRPPAPGERTAAPSPAGLEAQLQVTCGAPSGWRAASIQSWPGREPPVRSWMAIDPVAAAGPLDPAIPFVAIFTDRVRAIGYCAPLGDRPPGNARGRLYELEEGLARSLDPLAIEPSDATSLGVLWEPRDGGANVAWPPGRYVIEVGTPGETYRRWLGIEIHDLALPPITPTPVPTPTGQVPSVSPDASPDASPAAPGRTD